MRCGAGQHGERPTVARPDAHDVLAEAQRIAGALAMLAPSGLKARDRNRLPCRRAWRPAGRRRPPQPHAPIEGAVAISWPSGLNSTQLTSRRGRPTERQLPLSLSKPQAVVGAREHRSRDRGQMGPSGLKHTPHTALS